MAFDRLCRVGYRKAGPVVLQHRIAERGGEAEAGTCEFAALRFVNFVASWAASPDTLNAWAAAHGVWNVSETAADGASIAGVTADLSTGPRLIVGQVRNVDGVPVADMTFASYPREFRPLGELLANYGPARADEPQGMLWGIGGDAPEVANPGASLTFRWYASRDVPDSGTDIAERFSAAETGTEVSAEQWCEVIDSRSVLSLGVVGLGGTPREDLATVRLGYGDPARRADFFELDGTLYSVQSRRVVGLRQFIELEGARDAAA
ncbi:MAG: hypothetical protein OXG38_09585 [Chloroflexi bacterium]|nr:hypothetical protein [Chloroflexota bacterium]